MGTTAWVVTLLMAGVSLASEAVWYDPDGILIFGSGGDAHERDLQPWLDRNGSPEAPDDGLPFVDILRSVPRFALILVACDDPLPQATNVTPFASMDFDRFPLTPEHTVAEAEAKALDFVSQGDAVAVVLRRRLDDAPADNSGSDDTSGNSTTKYYSRKRIVQFQINMWTAIGLICVLAAAIFAMVNMSPEYDSLLYATFQANVNNPMSKFD